MAPQADKFRAFDSDLNDPPSTDAEPENEKAEIDLMDIRIMTQASSVLYSLTFSDMARQLGKFAYTVGVAGVAIIRLVEALLSSPRGAHKGKAP